MLFALWDFNQYYLGHLLNMLYSAIPFQESAVNYFALFDSMPQIYVKHFWTRLIAVISFQRTQIHT